MSVRLSAKLLVLVLGILFVFLGILLVIVSDRETRMLARKNAEQEQLLAESLVADLKNNMLAGRPRSTLNLIASLRGSYGLVRLDVVRRDGTAAFGSFSPPVAFPQVAEAFRTARETDFSEAGASPVHTNLFPLKNVGECRRCHGNEGEVLGVILISHSLEEEVHEVRASKRKLGILFAGAILAVGMTLSFATRKVVLTPLRVLDRGAEIIGTGDLSHRIAVKSGDELEELAGSFNEMARRLKETYDGLENMVKIRTAELNESVRLMRGILTSMSSGVVLLDRDGKVKVINRQGARLLGYSVDELMGRKLSSVAPETAGFFVGRMGAYEEREIRRPDEAMVPLGFTVSPYPGGEGEQEGVIVVFQDLTELRALQTELVTKERFAAMGRLVAGVAHEIRNPLFGISAIGQIFDRDLHDPGHRELAGALLSEVKRLNQLVEELLIYGRPMKLKRENTDLRVLWEEVLDLHRDELRRRGIRVTGDYALRHPVVHLDPYQIRQVFLNILRNALEAMPDGGTISIAMLLADRFIEFRVSDTGAGIPKDSLNHAFDLFFTTKPKGTGLGLPICRKIMQDHGGNISIQSAEGEGTTIVLQLPYSSLEERLERRGLLP